MAKSGIAQAASRKVARHFWVSLLTSLVFNIAGIGTGLALIGCVTHGRQGFFFSYIHTQDIGVFQSSKHSLHALPRPH